MLRVPLPDLAHSWALRGCRAAGSASPASAGWLPLQRQRESPHVPRRTLLCLGSLHLSAHALPTCQEPLCRGTCWVLEREHFFEQCLQFRNYVSLNCLPGCCPTQRKLLRHRPCVPVRSSLDTSEQDKGSRRGSQRHGVSHAASSVRSDKTPPPQPELQQSCSETMGKTRGTGPADPGSSLGGSGHVEQRRGGPVKGSSGFRSPPPHVPVTGGPPEGSCREGQSPGVSRTHPNYHRGSVQRQQALKGQEFLSFPASTLASISTN